jgi:carbon storage regulator
MLVVSRRPGQSILIGRDIEVFILEVDGMQVRVGINAPRSIRVLRRELLTQVESENRRAVSMAAGAVLDLPDLAQRLRHTGAAQAS